MRRLLIATVALLVLSGCKTSGLNPLKIEGQESWGLTSGVERLLTLLVDRAD
jgi:CHAT domain-containing protein